MHGDVRRKKNETSVVVVGRKWTVRRLPKMLRVLTCLDLGAGTLNGHFSGPKTKTVWLSEKQYGISIDMLPGTGSHS